MSQTKTQVSKDHRRRLQALCDLSDFSEKIDSRSLINLLEEVPDPETVIRRVTGELPADSEVLLRKWRETLTNLWASRHPNIPLLPDLPLTSEETAASAALQDARGYLKALDERSGRLVMEHGEILLHPKDITRLAAATPSLHAAGVLNVESEWACVPLRRLRASLQAARLIRGYKGQLVVVQSRYQRFLRFPAVVQFYILWHVDAYHVGWEEFAGGWGKFFRVMQSFLPLLWDTNEHISEAAAEEEFAWCAKVMEAFEPLWSEQGLLDSEPSADASYLISIFQQSTLPAVLEKLVLCDLFARYGLIAFPEAEGGAVGDCLRHGEAHQTSFRWTRLGTSLVNAERNHDLPCGIELLN